MMIGMNILIIGSSNTDLTVHINTMPKPGETVIGQEFTVGSGGKGANQAVGAARLGANVTFSCMLGNDEYGTRSISEFRNEQIDTSYVFTSQDAASGVAFIMVDSKGENCIIVDSGANMKFTPREIDKIKDFTKYRLVLSQLEIPLETVEYCAEICNKNGIPFILNPAPACKLPDSLFRKIDVITPNETEAQILTGIEVKDEASARSAAEALVAKGVKSVIITLGSKGSYIYSDGEGRIARAYSVKAVDTTAAGDIFNAAFCVARVNGNDIDKAVDFASAASAIAVTRKGAQSSAPYYNEVIEFIKNNKQKKS